VWTNPLDGSAYVWFNNYPSSPTWLAGGELIGGVGTSGANIRYAKLQDTGRASYVAVNPNNGGIAAWLNACSNLGPAPRNNVVLIEAVSIESGTLPVDQWDVFETTADGISDICTAQTIAGGDRNIGEYPTSIGPFTAHGISGCKYTGATSKVGVLDCPGVTGIQCRLDPTSNPTSPCAGFGSITPFIKCAW
jgi:hypothetical protein